MAIPGNEIKLSKADVFSALMEGLVLYERLNKQNNYTNLKWEEGLVLWENSLKQ